MTPTTKLFLIIFFFPQSIFPLVITISLYSWFSSDVTKILSPKPQGLLSFNLRLVKCLLKINFSASFKVIAFSVLKISIALSNFSSLLRVTFKKNMATQKAVTYAKRNNFIAWYCVLWMVNVLENVFRGVICSFAVNNNSCYEARTPTNSPFQSHAPPVCYVTFVRPYIDIRKQAHDEVLAEFDCFFFSVAVKKNVAAWTFYTFFC